MSTAPTTLAVIFFGMLAACDRVPAPDEGTPPLLMAAEQGNLPALDALLSRSPEPDIRDACRWTPLMKAALNGHRNAVQRLLQAGAAVDARDKGGYTALMLAASNGHAEVVSLLLANAATADQQEQTKGWTALIWAAKQGHLETVRILLANGADPALRDFSGRTAHQWAAEEGQTGVPALIADKAKNVSYPQINTSPDGITDELPPGVSALISSDSNYRQPQLPWNPKPGVEPPP